jgi:hypothetical protein
MFKMKCNDDEPHDPHVFTQHWRKTDLPWLRRPELYPAEWDADYSCKGITDVFCPDCAGPYEGWLMEQYGGHWDTCPRRAKALL